MKVLKDKVCIITGAGGGIGRGVALAFAKEGATLAICDVNRDSLEETKAFIEKEGRPVFSKSFDIREVKCIENFVNETGNRFSKLDVLVNVAGIMPDSRLEILTEELVDNIINVNLRAPIFFTKYAVPWMKKAGGGSIIHTSSVTGHNGFPEVAIYGATKGALMALARGHAMELALHCIRVNTVSPGTVDTPMLHRFLQEHAQHPESVLAEFNRIHPRGKIASTEEVANVFLFLAGDASANITAEDIRCDGGYCVQGGQPM